MTTFCFERTNIYLYHTSKNLSTLKYNIWLNWVILNQNNGFNPVIFLCQI
jgi:hypothetical protein